MEEKATIQKYNWFLQVPEKTWKIGTFYIQNIMAKKKPLPPVVFGEWER